ncbi:DUF2442 domain-containing protein [Geodermatophilus sp. SYSU D00684]
MTGDETPGGEAAREFVDVTGVRVLGNYVLKLTWADGVVMIVDVEPYLNGPALEPLRDPAVFATVTVDAEAGTVVWDNGADLSPEELRRVGRRVSGHPRRSRGGQLAAVDALLAEWETARKVSTEEEMNQAFGLTRGRPVEKRLHLEQLRRLLVHYVVAGKVAADPNGMRTLAWGRLSRLRKQHPFASPWHSQWERLLDGPLLNLLDALTSRSQYAHDLRQRSPWEGVLTAAEEEQVRAVAHAVTGTAPSTERTTPGDGR